MMANDYYKILGVSKSATIEEIKKAYRKLALQYHPDRGGDEVTAKKFNEVSEAYQILSDPQKRMQYDQFSAQGGPAPGWGDFQNANNQGGFEGMEFDFGGLGGFGDIFENFFGQAFSQVQAEVRITPAQAVLGDKLEANVGGEKISFDIPSGVQDGQAFRFPGKGKTHNRGKGDLILTVRIEMPRHVTKEQRELYEKLRESESKKRSWWN